MSDYTNLVKELRESVPNRRLMLTAADTIERLGNYVDLYIDMTDKAQKLARELIDMACCHMDCSHRRKER